MDYRTAKLFASKLLESVQPQKWGVKEKLLYDLFFTLVLINLVLILATLATK